jgi:hypothetical protein
MTKKTVILGILFILGSFGHAFAGKTCDRACLVALMDQYLSAVVKRNPAGAPIAGDVKFVENLQTIPVGKGLWETAASGPTEFKIYVADPVAGQIEFMGVLKDKNNPVLLGARLKIVGGKITEIDHMVFPLKEPLPAGLLKPRPGLVTPISPAERVPRAQMLKAADGYCEAIGSRNEIRLQTADGNINGDELDGSLIAETGDGNINIEGRFDALDARTGDGNLEITAKAGSLMTSEWKLHTGDGNIHIEKR